MERRHRAPQRQWHVGGGRTIIRPPPRSRAPHRRAASAALRRAMAHVKCLSRAGGGRAAALLPVRSCACCFSGGGGGRCALRAPGAIHWPSNVPSAICHACMAFDAAASVAACLCCSSLAVSAGSAASAVAATQRRGCQPACVIFPPLASLFCFFRIICMSDQVFTPIAHPCPCCCAARVSAAPRRDEAQHRIPHHGLPEED